MDGETEDEADIAADARLRMREEEAGERAEGGVNDEVEEEDEEEEGAQGTLAGEATARAQGQEPKRRKLDGGAQCPSSPSL